MYRRVLLSTVFAMTAFAGAHAADLAVVEAPRPVAPAGVFDWSGLYGGLHAGASSSNVKGQIGNDATPPVPSGDYSFSSIAPLVGAHAGFNLQFGSFVGGLEGDVDGVFLDAKKRFINSGYLTSNGHTYEQRVKSAWQASVRGRLGVAQDRTLFYGTAGVAFAGFDSEAIHFDPNSNTATLQNPYSKVRTGWTAGLGVEHAYSNNFSVRAEYRYTDLGSVEHVTFGGACNPIHMCGSDLKSKMDSHTLLLGMSYHFKPEAAVPAPVKTRY